MAALVGMPAELNSADVLAIFRATEPRGDAKCNCICEPFFFSTHHVGGGADWQN